MLTCKKLNLLFSTLPSDLLPFIFSFLSPKELCCLDSAILNHTDRPLFLSALLQRLNQNEESKNIRCVRMSFFDAIIRWYLCRRIPITNLWLSARFQPGVILMNSSILKVLLLTEISLNKEDLIALEQCSNLKILIFFGCSCPPKINISSILHNLSRLEELHLGRVPFSRGDIEILCRSCPLLKNLQLSHMERMGDEKLRLLVEGCPSLHSLILESLPITEESVLMLRTHRPLILLVAVKDCFELSLESRLSLLSEITIPTILNNDNDKELQIFALETLVWCIEDDSEEDPQVFELLTNKALLERAVHLLFSGHRVSDILPFFTELHNRGCHRLLVDLGIVPFIVRFFNSLEENDKIYCMMILEGLGRDHTQYLLTSGVLSLFRPHLLKVSLCLSF
jgi:hypothetical protein